MKEKITVSFPAALPDRFHWDARREVHIYLTPVQRQLSPLHLTPLNAPHLVQFRPEGFFVLIAA